MRIPQDVLEKLKQIRCVEHSATIDEQLDRALYVKVNKVLEALGGKWNKKTKAHLFEDDPADRITDAVTTGQVLDPKKEFQFFETPVELAERMVNMAAIGKGHAVLEPSAGKGRIVNAITLMAPYRLSATAVEIQPSLIAVLKQLACDSVVHADFLAFHGMPGYDRIIMNPPFRNGQDTSHVLHAWDMLNPGGRLVAITSPGWTFRQDKKHTAFREWTTRTFADVHRLDAGTFKESDTMVNACLIVVDKPA